MISPGVIGSVRLQKEPAPCGHCGSTSQVGRGLCLKCLLYRGLGEDTYDNDTLDSVLDEIDVRDADWRLGNYQILEEIGRGGMGVIYRARQRHSRRIVALKRILAYHADSRDTLVRFRREAEAAASLDHPNILPIYEVGDSDDGLPFFSMKLATGGSLLESQVALHSDPRRSVTLIAKVCRAVQYAHTHGILHRDLKPGNILLDGHGEPMVSDFGLAKWLDTTSDLTRTLTVFGTPGYIAPEQTNGPAASLKPTADTYSLGAILFDLLAGRPPFLGEHALSVIQQAANKPAPKLRALKPSLDRDLETICSRCLEREPAARYRSAGDLAEDLQRWLQGRPIIARPVSAPVRVWRWSKRNPKLASSVAGCILLGAAAGIWQIQNRVTAHEQVAALHSIAVLPFLNLDNPSLDDTFAADIATCFQAEFKNIGPARVVAVSEPANSLTAIRGTSDIRAAAHSHNTHTVMFGSYRSVLNGKRVSVRLMDQDGNLLQSITGVYDSGSLTQQLSHASARAVYSLIGEKEWSSLIASQQDPALRSEKVRDLVLAGRELMERQSTGDTGDLDRAIQCFQKALDLEPRSILARAYFARTVATRMHYRVDTQLLALAERAANEALRLAPESGESHRAHAAVLVHRGEPKDALDETLRFMELSGPDIPAIALAGNLTRMLGRPDKAIAWFQMMAYWERRPADDVWLIGDCWSTLLEDERAEQTYGRVSELHPELPFGWVGLCHLRIVQRDFERARAVYLANRTGYNESVYPKEIAAQLEFFARNFAEAEKLYADLAGKDGDGGGRFYGAVSYQSALGRLRLAAHDGKKGRLLLQNALNKEMESLRLAPHHPETLYRVAAIESCLRDTNSALDHLQQASAEGFIDYRSLDLDPRFDGVRDDTRFKQIFDAMVTRVASLRNESATTKVASEK
jgi:serine/threonine protein kinase/tetratricopeptide (TPR) repeat protein